MLVAITGGTGFVGSHTVAQARAAGHQVRMLIRSPEKAARMLAMFELTGDEGIELVTADLDDRAAMAAGLDGCDAVVHVASLFSLDPRDGAEMNRLNPAAVDTIITEATARGLDPIIDVSTLGVYQPPPADFVTADLPPTAGCGPYTRSKIAAEHIARRAQDDGAPVVTIYPGGIFGPRDPNPGLSDSVAVVRDIMRWRLPSIPRGAFMPFVDVRDVAALCVGALEPGRGPRRYLLAGHQTELRGIVRIAMELTGRRLPLLPAPRPLLMASGRVADALAVRLDRSLPVSAETVDLMAVGLDHPHVVYDGSAALRDYGLPAYDTRTTLIDTLLWLVEAGHLAPKHIGRLAEQLRPSGSTPR